MAVISRFGANLEDVLPELFAFVFGPVVVALKDGDDELRRSIDDLREWTVDRFHAVVSTGWTCERTKAGIARPVTLEFRPGRGSGPNRALSRRCARTHGAG